MRSWSHPGKAGRCPERRPGTPAWYALIMVGLATITARRFQRVLVQSVNGRGEQSNTPHFHWAKSGEYVTQVTAMGPLGLEYLSAKDDPRNNKS